MSNARWLLVLLIAGALAVAAKFMAGSPVSTEALQEVAPPDLHLLSFDARDAAEIVVEDEDGVRLHLVRTGAPVRPETTSPSHDDGAQMRDPIAGIGWELAVPSGAPLDEGRIAEAVLSLADLRAFRRVEIDEEDADPSAFGLEPPRRRLVIRLDGPEARPLELWVGEATPVMVGDYPTYYVRLPNRDDVFAAGGPGLALVGAAPEDLLLPPASLEDDVPAQGDVHD